MSALIEMKQYVRNFINKYEAYLKPVAKLLLALIVLMTINGKLGYMHKIDSISIVLIVALMCSFMPSNFIVLMSGVFVILHMYALSLETFVVILVLFIILFLLYFRLSPRDSVVALLVPIACAMGIPYIFPIIMGLIGGPYSLVSIACGVIVYYALGSVSDNAATLTTMETEDMATRLKLVVDGIMDNKAMIALIIAFSITVIVVFVIKNLSINYSWPIAIVAGALTDAIVVLVLILAMDVSVSVVGLVFGTILAVAIGFVMQFLFFNVDYNKTEKVQFEDDDYVYYVKAVPKVTVATSSKTVKRINSSKRRPPQRQRVRDEE